MLSYCSHQGEKGDTGIIGQPVSVFNALLLISQGRLGEDVISEGTRKQGTYF